MLYNNGENVFQIWLTNATKGKELWKLNKRKGFYNFVKYVTEQEIKELQRKKNCKVIDKTVTAVEV